MQIYPRYVLTDQLVHVRCRLFPLMVQTGQVKSIPRSDTYAGTVSEEESLDPFIRGIYR